MGAKPPRGTERQVEAGMAATDGEESDGDVREELSVTKRFEDVTRGRSVDDIFEGGEGGRRAVVAEIREIVRATDSFIRTTLWSVNDLT